MIKHVPFIKFLCLIFCLALSLGLHADQLAYITKQQARKAARKLQKSDVLFLYCGCCPDQPMQIIAPESVTFRHTNFEDYYEVIINYVDADGTNQSIGIDMAYTWILFRKKLITVGEWLKYPHDPCTRLERQQLAGLIR